MKIKFQNFALFDNSNIFELSPLTFLIGGNNSGKSTFVKGLEIIGNGELLNLNQVRKGKSEILVSYELLEGLYRRQTFEIGYYDEFYSGRSFNYINSEGKEILKVSPFMGSNESENVVFHVDRFLRILEDGDYIITDKEISELLNRNRIVKKHLVEDIQASDREVFHPDEEIESLERWFFEIGIVELFELDEFEVEFQNRVIDFFIQLFKPYTFEAWGNYKNGQVRYWNKKRKPLSIQVIKNSDLSVPKRIYQFGDFLSKPLSHQLEMENFIPPHQLYDEEFRTYWLKKFFGQENPLKFDIFKDGIFEIKLNDQYLTEQGSGITKILQYILFFSTLTVDVFSNYDGLMHDLEKCKSLAERQENLFRYRKNQAINRKQIIYIEEPEVHLHPNFQILLSEMIFQLALNSRYHFIIETHSEYIIRKLQLLKAENKSTPSKLISIMNFGSGKNFGKVKTIHIDSNGSLNKAFYPGFFDLSQDLQYQLMKTNRNNLN
jgi:hypothetical protein